MISLFNFNESEILTFFVVAVRFSVIFAIAPLMGDRLVPVPVKLLLALAVTIAVFPSLVNSGYLKPFDALVWAHSAGGLIGTLAIEVAFGLLVGFVSRLAFDSIAIGANFLGSFMGFASASQFDPHQESQTEVIAQIQTTIAMLLFLVLDGHHLILRSVFESYRIVGIGKAQFYGDTAAKLIEFTGEALKFGVQIAAPMAISLFSVNVGLGIISKAMPQLNVLVLSFAVIAIVGFFVLYFGMTDFQNIVEDIFEKSYEWIQSILVALTGR